VDKVVCVDVRWVYNVRKILACGAKGVRAHLLGRDKLVHLVILLLQLLPPLLQSDELRVHAVSSELGCYLFVSANDACV
jgi:hypothetical protein